MEVLVLTLLMLAAVLLSSVIDQLVPKVSSPLIQIGLGLLIALFAPSQIQIGLDPNLFLVLLISPLLYDEAKNMDKKALWQNKGPVLSLAIGLVLVTAIIVGFSVHWLEPTIPLAAAFALGAAIGPTDAVAVASLPKDTAISSRDKSILEAESVLNDASGIVTFQFALAAVAGSFSLLSASTDFVASFLGGLAIGAALGYLGNFIVRRVRSWGLENTTFHVLFEVFVPFIVYLVANAAGTSGIIAAVAAGLVNVVSPRAMSPSISRMNIVSSSVWRVLSFALNGIVFVILGTQLPRVMQHSWDDVSIDNAVLIGYVLLIVLISYVVRFLWLCAMDRLRNRRLPADQRTSWKASLRSWLVMTLGGPKGTITLAVVLTIPYTIVYSDPLSVVRFPQRDLITFLACGVIVVTLLIATFVVPLVASRKEPADGAERCDETQVNLEILRSVIEEIAARQTVENRAATQAVIHSYNGRIARIKNHHDIEDEPITGLRLKAIAWERSYVTDLVERECVDPLAGYQYLARLSQAQSLIEHHGGRTSLQNAFHRLRVLARTSWHRILSGLPGVSPTDRAHALRELQLDGTEHVIAKLQHMLTSPECDEPAENVSALIMEYQRIATMLRNANPSITAFTRSADKTAEIERLGLRLELEQIQSRYEAGDLSRSGAKRLRDNVNLMQMDLEDSV